MALPPTGSTISIGQIRNYFVAGGFSSTYALGQQGNVYLGISVGTTISMSATFGGFYFPAT